MPHQSGLAGIDMPYNDEIDAVVRFSTSIAAIIVLDFGVYLVENGIVNLSRLFFFVYLFVHLLNFLLFLQLFLECLLCFLDF
jgi:hypothetical protein